METVGRPWNGDKKDPDEEACFSSSVSVERSMDEPRSLEDLEDLTTISRDNDAVATVNSHRHKKR